MRGEKDKTEAQESFGGIQGEGGVFDGKTIGSHLKYLIFAFLSFRKKWGQGLTCDHIITDQALTPFFHTKQGFGLYQKDFYSL
jgi:hypothetical protein